MAIVTKVLLALKNEDGYHNPSPYPPRRRILLIFGEVLKNGMLK
jgi:hypothetical protein